MKKQIAFFLGFFLAAGVAHAASTINPLVPAANAPIASAPVRNNFQAAYNDVNNLLTQFANIVAPAGPSTNQYWMNTTSTPWVENIFDGTQWVQTGTLNPSTHVFTPVSGGSPGGSAGGDLGGTYPNPTVLSVAHVNTGVLGGAYGGTGIANTGKTITLGGNLTTSGAYASTFTMTGATSVTFPTSGTLATVANANVASVSNSDGTLTISPTTGAVVASIALGNANTWSGQQTFVAPILGTPASGILTNATGLPISTGMSGLGTGIATALAVNTGSAGAPVLFNGALGTPTSGVITNLTGTCSTCVSNSATLDLPLAGGTMSGNIAMGGNNITGGGTGSFTTLASAAHAITSASANALAVGLNGATNPAFSVDASTASQAAGLNVKGAATGGTVAVAAIDSGSNTNLTINAKGTGTIGIGSVSTGKVTITPAVQLAAITGSSQCLQVDTSGNVTGAGSPCAASNGEAFMATASGAQTGIASGTWTQVTFGTVNFDTGSMFASSTFTPTVAGYYQLNTCAATGDASAFISQAAVGFYKNGSAYDVPASEAGLTNPSETVVVCKGTIMHFNGSTDAATVYVNIAGTAPELTALHALFSNFSGSYLHP